MATPASRQYLPRLLAQSFIRNGKPQEGRLFVVQQRNFARKTKSEAPIATKNVAASGSAAPPPPAADPWQEVKDPNGSNQTYWWNPQTNEVTPLGAAKPVAGQAGGAMAAAAGPGAIAQPAQGGGFMRISFSCNETGSF